MKPKYTPTLNEIDENLALSETEQVKTVFTEEEMNDMLTGILENKLSTNLFFVNHNHTGPTVEAVLKLLPDEVFIMLTSFVVGQQDDPDVQEFVSGFVVKLAQKFGIKISEIEPYYNACTNFVNIVSCEMLYRQGFAHYTWPNDFFAKITGDVMQLTENGYKHLLSEIDVKTETIQ